MSVVFVYGSNDIRYHEVAVELNSQEGMVPQALVDPNAATVRIERALPALAESEARVAKTILSDPEAVLRQSAAEVAKRAGTAPSTVVVACRRMGFRGFQDLKIGIARGLGPEGTLRHASLPERASPQEVVRSVLLTSAQSLVDATTTIDPASFTMAVSLIGKAERILVVGAGTSRSPADDAAHRLRLLGLPAEAPPDHLSQCLAARQLTRTDVCVAITHTGATRSTLAVCEAAKEAGAPVVALTSFRSAPVTEVASVSIVAGGAELGFRLEAMTSRLAHLAVVDALFVALALDDPERARAALDVAASVTAEHTL